MIVAAWNIAIAGGWSSTGHGFINGGPCDAASPPSIKIF
jgi:hypothetical protein